MAPKKTTEVDKIKARVAADEKYDWERTQGPDPRDPRTTGPPCHGEHVEAPPGRGSPSGSNKFAIWKACQGCGLRLSYTPTWGSHGKTRQAGPLDQDTRKQIEEKKPQKGSPELNNHKISYDAQERSLETKLAQVKQKKLDWLKTQEYKDQTKIADDLQPTNKGKGSTKGTGDKSLDRDQVESSLMLSQGPLPSNGYPEMNITPGRKSRKPEEPAEELEYEARERGTEKSWSLVSTPE